MCLGAARKLASVGCAALECGAVRELFETRSAHFGRKTQPGDELADHRQA